MVQKMNAPLVEEDGEELDDIPQIGESASKEAHVFPISLASILFHILMMFACMYYSILLTNWGDAHINDYGSDLFENNALGYWIKISAQWVCFLIYTFSLVAPALFPDRDFS